MNLFYDFENDIMIPQNINVYRTEWKIAAPDESIGGTIDFVGEFQDGTCCIIDWKTSKDLKNKLTNRYQKAKYEYIILLFIYVLNSYLHTPLFSLDF